MRNEKRPALLWEMPRKRWLNVESARKRAATLLIAAITESVRVSWQNELPSNAWGKANRKIAAAIRAAIRRLTLNRNSEDYREYWSNWHLASAPTYWEPANASVHHECSTYQVCAYRWSATVINLFVRNSLEDLHAEFTSDASMAALNKGIRNAALDVLVQDDWVGFHLGSITGRLIADESQGANVFVPKSVGLATMRVR